jgi:hypothetical protein
MNRQPPKSLIKINTVARDIMNDIWSRQEDEMHIEDETQLSPGGVKMFGGTRPRMPRN